MTWFLLALASAFLSSFAAITQKKVLFKMEALEFSFFLSIANLLLSIPFFFFIDYSTLNNFNMLILFVKSLIGVCAFLCVMISLKNLEISNALPLLALTPGFVAVFAYIFLGEALNKFEIIGLVLLVIGTFVLESNDKIFPPPSIKSLVSSRYYKFILLALILFTASSVLDKLLLKQLHLTPISITAFQHVYFAIIFLITFLAKNKNHLTANMKLDSNSILWILLISVFTIGYRYTQIVAVSLASVALVLAVKRTSVFWATLIGGKIFKDKHLLKRSIAALIILAGTILILRD